MSSLTFRARPQMDSVLPARPPFVWDHTNHYFACVLSFACHHYN